MDNNVLELIEELRKAPQVALFSHVSPDGDCLGSMLAIGLALEKLGKEVFFYNPDPIPQHLSFLPAAGLIRKQVPEPWPEILLFIDCTDLERATIDKTPEHCRVLNLDHHISNSFFGDLNWVEPDASASGEVAMELIDRLGVHLDKDIATNLYTAIVTDTGLFQYSSTTAQTHRLAAQLLEENIDLTEIHHRIFDQKPLAQVRLLQRALDGLEINAGGELAVISLTREDFTSTGAEDSMSEGLINHARSIAGVEVAIMIREVGPSAVKVSLRSNTWVNVNEIAAQFGGGGHKRAAGCTLELTLHDAKKLITETLEGALNGGRDC